MPKTALMDAPGYAKSLSPTGHKAIMKEVSLCHLCGKRWKSLAALAMADALLIKEYHLLHEAYLASLK